MTAFSVAIVISYFYPPLKGALFFLALSIAVSRIVLAMHFLSDVLRAWSLVLLWVVARLRLLPRWG